MRRSISAEWLKLRHSRIGLVLVTLPVISLLIGSVNYAFNRGVLVNGWYSLWTQVSLFYGEFFLPILVAILCAYVCRLEHLNRNWNMVLTAPVSVASIFAAKWFTVGLLILFAQALFLGLYWVAGLLLSMPGPFPPETIGWAMRGWYACLAISAFQLGLSLRIRSFAVPVGIALVAVLIGLGLYVAKLGLFFPYSLLTIGMEALSQDKLDPLQNALFWIMNSAYGMLFAFWSIRGLKDRDVKTA
jgi:lantibiotic transport system permease protein